MNVLLFVTTMMIVIASLTYARLESYRSMSLKQAQFIRYMDKTERGYINSTAEWWYINSHAETRESSNEPADRSQARSRLSFLVFIDKAKREQSGKEYQKIHFLAKKLIYSLYRNQPFFQEFEQQRSDIVDALLASLMIADNLPKEQKIKKASDLAHLNIDDPLLNSFLYFILKGLTVPEEPSPKTPTSDLLPLGELLVHEPEGESEDEVKEPSQKEGYKSPKGYYSLLDFITLDEASKIRVYLAPRELLKAIFDDKETVDSIIALRNELFKKVSNDSMSKADASIQFKTFAAPRSDPHFDDAILDFGVSKTNPKNYE